MTKTREIKNYVFVLNGKRKVTIKVRIVISTVIQGMENFMAWIGLMKQQMSMAMANVRGVKV